MKKQDLERWYELCQQIVNGYHISEWEYMELIHLNHQAMEASHRIHNDNMMDIKPKYEMPAYKETMEALEELTIVKK